MITEQEFLNAIDVARKYKKQVLQMISEMTPETKKTLISDWVKQQLNNPDGSKYQMRLLHNLPIYSNRYSVNYIEDVDLRDFIRIRNVGQGTLNKFLELTQGLS